ncbi:putative 2-dehydropantoate 2-reductase [Rubripirellula amarantea]|nr:putative 2-dehydropantoate 2-reductase [Rubripirellula amarantea]
MTKQSYAIIGSGALGGLYGALLAKAGHEVHFLLHSDYEYVKQHGLTVESIWGDFHLPSVHAHNRADSIPPCDVTLLALKTTNNHLLEKLLPPSTCGAGVVLCLQNGLDVESDAAAIVGNDRVLGGSCFLCSNKVGPGHIRHLDQGRIVFGEWGSTAIPISERARRIESEFQSAGIEVNATHDLPMTRWRKLLWNIPFNGLSVVLNASTKELIEDNNSVALSKRIINEVHAGAAGCGVMIPEMFKEKTMEATRVMVPYDSSMRLDYLAGRPMEIDAIFRRPLAAAERAGVMMPAVATLADQLSFLGRKHSA